jgi:vanillate O-demethylase monooxygenase subunit
MMLSEDDVITALRRTWQPVANASALSREPVIGVTLLERELVVARFDTGRILAADVACPHKGARLSRGCIHEGSLQCGYHGWRFDPTGACESIPSLLEESHC